MVVGQYEDEKNVCITVLHLSDLLISAIMSGCCCIRNMCPKSSLNSMSELQIALKVIQHLTLFGSKNICLFPFSLHLTAIYNY